MGKKRTPAAGEGGVADGTTTSTANNSPGDLKTLIHEHSLFFDQLVELIPARFFLPYSGDDKPWFPGLSMSEKKKFKAQTRENIIKSRRDRLDPTQPSSTLDLLKKSLAEEKESSDEEPEDDDDDNNDDDDDEEEEDEEQEQQDVGESEKAHNKVTLTGELPVTYEELQERLRRRIAELASGRNTRPESRLKQERKKELKNKKKLKGESKKNKDKGKDKDAASTSNSSKRKREDGNDEIFSKNKKKNKVGEPTDITFGQVRIDGKDNKKRQKKLPKEKELERAKRLEEIKNDPEKGKKVSWKAAVSKAAGEKVHDNPKLLKQSIKREKKRQQKNAKKWKERDLTVAKAKAEKQSKRTENIKERIH
jgi:Surfeit locus protein 6/60S ribosome biogenesis protein Rrp14